MQWKPIPGYEGYYEVSDCGDVRRINPEGGSIVGKLLKPDMAKGYFRVTLSRRNQQKRFQLHRLVMMAFAGDPPPGCSEVAHNDGCRTNNVLSNLRWTNHIENESDKLRHGTLIFGTRHHKNKLSVDEVIEIRRLGKTRELTQVEITEKFGVSRTNVQRIIYGKIWKHV
jgi:hypothetical protein